MAVAAPPFTGFTPAAIQFLADLAENNDRAWFQPRKAEFERLLKDPLEAMIAALSDRLAARGVPMLADPKRSPFRIYRDTRFSKDKSPYKTHLGASFPWIETAPGTSAGGDHDERAHGNGGYFHFQPGEMYVGGGMWQMEKPRIDAFRAAVRRRSRPGPRRDRGAGIRRLVRRRPPARGAQADAARLPRGPPAGAHVPVEGRRVRAAAGRRRGALAGPPGSAGRGLRHRDPGPPVPRRRSIPRRAMARSRSDAPILTTRALNRALLARQLLLERADTSIVEAVEQVGGLQAQYAPSSYVALVDEGRRLRARRH